MTDHTEQHLDMVRDDFEAWASHFFTRGELDRHSSNGARPNEYRVLHIERMWSAYQAATQRSAERIAELEARVKALREANDTFANNAIAKDAT